MATFFNCKMPKNTQIINNPKGPVIQNNTGVKLPDWVNVDDRLPKKGGVLAVIYEEYNHKTGQGNISYIDRLSYLPEFNMWIRSKGQGLEKYARVTRWMPLPEAPEATQ